MEPFSHAPDPELLAAYVERGDEMAFGELVRRHQNMVLAVCRRRLPDAALAQDAAQMTFLLMIQKARALRSHTNLAGWLYQTANFQAANLQRKESTRKAVSLAVVNDPAAVSEAPTEDPGLQAHLDEALMNLREPDREAVVLRFFSGQSLRDVGQAQGTTEEAARKRISRALERMADFLRGRGIASGSVATLTAALTIPAAAAPIGFASAVAASAHSAQLAAAATAQAAWWAKLKIAGLLAAAISVPLIWQWNANRALQRENEHLRKRQAVVAASIAPEAPSEFPREAPTRAGSLSSLQVPEPNRLFQLLDALFAAESQQRHEARVAAWTRQLQLTPAQVETTKEALRDASEKQRDALRQLSSGEVDFMHVATFFLAERDAQQRIEAALDPAQRASFGPLLERDREELANELALWRVADLQPTLKLTNAQHPEVLAILKQGVRDTIRTLYPPRITSLPGLLEQLDAIGAAEHTALSRVLTPEQHAAFQDQTIRRRQALDLLFNPRAQDK